MEAFFSLPGQAVVVAALIALTAIAYLIHRRSPRWSGPYTAKFPEYKGFIPPPAEPDFDLTTSIEPRYRPFRWGAYQVNMGIRTIPHQEWLVLHTSYPSYMRLREARHSVYKEHSVRILPSPSKRNELAALETARAIAGFLANRYPNMFQVLPRGSEKSVDGWDIRYVKRLAQPGVGLPEKEWTLLDLGKGGDNPMQVAGELTPDDLAVMMPEEEGDSKGQYRFVAGSICTAGFWRLDEKIGLLLRDIHLKGKVAQFEEKLMTSMDRWFAKLNPNSLAERNNYFFQVFSPVETDPQAMTKLHAGTFAPNVVPSTSPLSSAIRGDDGKDAVQDGTELSWSHTTNGPENLFNQTVKGSVLPPGVAPPPPPTPARGAQDLAMRSERQTLRKLPRSGAVVFTVRTYLTPLTTMAEEPGVPGRLASAMRSWPEDIAWYKAADLYRDTVLPWLDEKHAEQVKLGICTEGEEEKVKARRAYPL